MGKSKAIVIGAGPSGLVSAKELAKQGWNVEVYEALDRVGGMCRSLSWNGYDLDIGPHIFHTADNSLSEYWLSLFGDLLVEGEYWSMNVKGESYNELYDYPLSWESISTFPAQLKRDIVNEISDIDKSDKAKAKNYKDYIDALAGPTLRKMFFERYPEKIWGISVNDMTADWAPKRINIHEKKSPFFCDQWTAVGKNGSGPIYQRISDEIESLGGKVYLNTLVSKIETQGPEIKAIHTRSQDRKININPGDVVISTMPVTNLLNLLGEECGLNYRGVMIFYLDCASSEILPGKASWFYYDSPDVYFTRITEPKKMNVKMPSDNRTLLTVEVPYSVGDQLDKKNVDCLCQEIISQVEKVGLIRKDTVQDIKLIKEKYVYPVQQKGYQEELAKIKGFVSQYRQLYSLGAGAEFNYTDTQVLFRKAFDLVESLTGDAVLRNIKQLSVRFNKSIEVGGLAIGDDFSPYIIAEAGMNHNGSLAMAKKLVEAAAGTGCNAVKFQTFLPHSRVSTKVKAVDFSEDADGIEESMSEMFSRLSMPFSEQRELFAFARDRGVDIFSTPFDFESVDFLESMGVGLYKVASMDLVNLPLIRYIAKTQKPIILSTGMSNLGAIEEALDEIRKTGNTNVALLHCNSTYPANPEDMNVNAIKTLKQCFNVPVGLSDHSFGLLVSQVALSIGANIIERHFTLDCTMEGPDHILSSEPSEMKRLVESAQKIKLILGDGVKRVQPTEYETINFQRKALYAKCSIQKGQIIRREMVSIKGPSGSILPKYIDIVIGRTARNDIKEDYPIEWKDI